MKRLAVEFLPASRSFRPLSARFLFRYLLATLLVAVPDIAGAQEIETSDQKKTAERRTVQRSAPYPPSTVISKVDWAPKASIVRLARGSDNFPLTWADDGHIYTTWGDGNGFGELPRRSMGFARIEGSPPATIRGIDIRSDQETLGNGRKGKKAWGILSVEGVLYLWMGHADQRGGQAQLAWSDDHAKSWKFADWKFKELGLIGFVNFGRDYAGARDEYVYAYSHDGPQADTPASRFVLLRVPKTKILQRNAYEFFSGIVNDKPTWSRRITARAAVFEHRDACLRSAMTWNRKLRRYLWWQHIPQPPGHKDRGDTRFDGGFGIYDAPEPWGPWTTAFFSRAWDVGPGEHGDFPAKWISSDGKSAYLVFSGDDCFSVRAARFQLNAEAAP